MTGWASGNAMAITPTAIPGKNSGIQDHNFYTFDRAGTETLEARLKLLCFGGARLYLALRIILPFFMTKFTLRSDSISCSGSLGTAMISAKSPGAIAPRSLEMRS